MSASRNIPEDIKQEVRQKSGFGCVICGSPIYHYEHIIDWAEIKKHIPDEMCLLCPNHHEDKKKKLLTRKMIREAAANPINLQKGKTAVKTITLKGSRCSLEMGGLKFKNFKNKQGAFFPIMIEKHTPFIFEIVGKEIFFTMRLADENGKELFNVFRNEVSFSSELWDVTFISNRLTIESENKDFVFQIHFKPPNTIKIVKLDYSWAGYEISLNSERINILYPIRPTGGRHNVTFKGEKGAKIIADIGFLIGPCPQGFSAAITGTLPK